MGTEVGFTCFQYTEGKVLGLALHGERIDQCFLEFGHPLSSEQKEVLSLSLRQQAKFLPKKGSFKIKVKLFANPLGLKVSLGAKRQVLRPVDLLCQEEKQVWPANNLVKNFDYSVRQKQLNSASSIYEILYFDKDQKILDSTFSSFFALKGNRLFSTSHQKQQVLGVFRRRLLEKVSDLGLTLEYRDLFLTDLGDFDQIFLTNEVQFIVPVKQIINGQQKLNYKISSLSTITKGLYNCLKREEVDLCQTKLFY